MTQHAPSQLLIEPGILAIFGAVPKTAAHQHTLIQITLPMGDADMRLTLPNNDEIQLTGASIINQTISHQLTMQTGWVILIEPSCNLGMQLMAKLADKAFIEIEINKPLNSTQTLSELLSLCGLTHALQTILDARIARLLDKLNLCIGKECVKPQRWRPYLLWRRLVCAVQTLQQEKTATEAAYIAGFSDSAHLSRTFKKQFGISLREYSKKRQGEDNHNGI